MYFTRLMFFFVLISYYLTSSCFIWKTKKPEPEPDLRPKANPDEVAEFNRIIESNGWKSITGILHCDNKEPATVAAFSSTELIIENDFKTKKEFAYMVLSAIYENMLMKLIAIYEDKINKYYTYKNDYNNRIRIYGIYVHELHLKNIIKSFAMLEPLTSCMYDALKYFEKCDHETHVDYFLNILKKLMNNINKGANCHDIHYIMDINNVIKKKSNVNMDNIKKYIVVKDSETFVITYLNKLQNLGGDKNNFMPNPRFTQHEDIVKEGVVLFCYNFGFTE